MQFVNINSKFVIILCLIIAACSATFYLNKVKFDDEASFSGDEWEYQSMAVNLAQGYGLMKVGAIAGDYVKDYKFKQLVAEIYQPTLKSFTEAGKIGGGNLFYRTPGYVVFLGGIYKLFGVHPEVVKKIQLLLIISIASFLPYIGFYYWKKSGLLIGIVSNFAYLITYAKSLSNTGITYSNQIMTEELTAFGLFIFTLTFMFWEKKRRPARVFFLGVITGLNLLIKGSNVFIPLIILIYLGILVIRIRLSKLNLGAFILGTILVVLPYSYYASKISGSTVILSTQATAALLESNNEYAIDGGWHPEGFTQNPNAFYNQPEIKPLSLPAKVFAFYTAFPEMVPEIFLAKIRLGFNQYVYLKMALVLIGLSLLKQLFIFRKFSLIIQVLISLWLYLIFSRKTFLFNTINLLPSVDLLLAGLMVIIFTAKFINKVSFKIDLPAPFVILFLNYLLLTITFLGWPRYIQVIDFIFILVFVKYLHEVIIPK